MPRHPVSPDLCHCLSRRLNELVRLSGQSKAKFTEDALRLYLSRPELIRDIEIMKRLEETL